MSCTDLIFWNLEALESAAQVLQEPGLPLRNRVHHAYEDLQCVSGTALPEEVRDEFLRILVLLTAAEAGQAELEPADVGSVRHGLHQISDATARLVGTAD